MKRTKEEQQVIDEITNEIQNNIIDSDKMQKLLNELIIKNLNMYNNKSEQSEFDNILNKFQEKIIQMIIEYDTLENIRLEFYHFSQEIKYVISNLIKSDIKDN